MRFGGFIFKKWNSPEEWAQIALSMGYSAVYFPVDYRADIKDIDGYTRAAREANLVIAEIGVWNNTLNRDEQARAEAIEKSIKQLELAEYIGAKCCVNIAGSCSDQWDGPHKNNFTEKTFNEIVAVSQTIIDAVNPKKSFYTLEPMPWMYPDSADSYLMLIKAIDRKGFGVHLDPVNITSSPRAFYNTGELLKDFFQKLGPHIKSCHAKDIKLGGSLTVHLDECRPGLGSFDFKTYLSCMEKIDKDTPLMLEHMSIEEDFVEATKYVKAVAAQMGIKL